MLCCVGLFCDQGLHRLGRLCCVCSADREWWLAAERFFLSVALCILSLAFSQSLLTVITHLKWTRACWISYYAEWANNTVLRSDLILILSLFFNHTHREVFLSLVTTGLFNQNITDSLEIKIPAMEEWSQWFNICVIVNKSHEEDQHYQRLPVSLMMLFDSSSQSLALSLGSHWIFKKKKYKCIVSFEKWDGEFIAAALFLL